MGYRTCRICGAALDPEEICECCIEEDDEEFDVDYDDLYEDHVDYLVHSRMEER